MKTVTRLLIYISILLFTTVAIARDSTSVGQRSRPIPVEVFFGNDRVVTEITLIKKFTGIPKFGIIASSYYAADYKNELRNNESMNVLLLTYVFTKV